VGSVATLLEPGATELFRWISKKTAPVVFDPNVRPSIQVDKSPYRTAVERWIDVARIVKLSEDDFVWLYGSVDETIIRDWQERGVLAVVVTRAENGITAYGAGHVIEVPAVKVDLVDSVGAGDTIGAILVEGVLKYGIEDLIENELREVLIRAARAAAITCSRAGANPPARDELEKP
jgi:fructokinase